MFILSAAAPGSAECLARSKGQDKLDIGVADKICYGHAKRRKEATKMRAWELIGEGKDVRRVIPICGL